MILTKHVFSATTRGNTTYLFDHLRKYHTAESCTGPILQTCTRPYPPYLKLHTFSNSSTSYILHPSLHAINWYLWPTRTWRKIRWTQVLKMKVNQHGEWEFWEGASRHEWAHMKYKCLSFCRYIFVDVSLILFIHLFIHSRDALKMAIAKLDPRSPGVRLDPHLCRTQYIVFRLFHPNRAGHQRVPEPL